MDGRPVWLASYSLASRSHGIVATGRYSQQQRRAAIARLKETLADVGDPERIRVFRMNVTMCIHKAVTDQELATLVPAWQDGKGVDIAGGPIEVLEESVPGAPSTRPCENPRRGLLDPGRRDLWLPLDCGQCPPCLARAAFGGIT